MLTELEVRARELFHKKHKDWSSWDDVNQGTRTRYRRKAFYSLKVDASEGRNIRKGEEEAK